MPLRNTELATRLFAIPDGKADVINGRAVLREGGYFIVEGMKNKRVSWNVAAERLARGRQSA